MGIEALPQSAVRAIGASQVLNDTAAAVKELVDNALDAHATSISIEISSNTLDTIQVRDNGHGIAPQDRHLVARPHCTSKISSEDDLKTIGGTSLGFRGEALASVAEMSGSLIVNTRVNGEQVAAALTISQQGEVVRQERASLPVGTTVKICDFLKAHPVRRQVALKNSEKCLKKIKHILQSYAFARPSVRMSFRVLRAKTDKANWTYAPMTGGNAEDAAFKIVGAASASQCTWSVIEESGFTLQAFLPRPDADVTKINNIGSFLSIDGRPLSTSLGTPKQITKIFREVLKRVRKDFEGIKEPFIYLDITCPVGSYDANIEPAKDDVLFEDADRIVELARRLFDAAYLMTTKTAEPVNYSYGPQPNESSPKLAALDKYSSVTLESSLREIASTPTQITEPRPDLSAEFLSEDTMLHTEGRSKDRGLPAFRNNMYGCDEGDLELINARPAQESDEAYAKELRQLKKDVSVSNPWIIAKLNAPSKRQHAAMDQNSDSLMSLRSTKQLQNAQAAEYPLSIDLTVASLPTPRHSSPIPQHPRFHPSDHVPDVRMARDGRMIGPPSLPPPQRLQRSPSNPRDRSQNETLEGQEDRSPHAYENSLPSVLAGPPAGTPLHAIPDVSTKPRRSPQMQTPHNYANPPFRTPVSSAPPRENVWFDHLEDEGANASTGIRKRRYPGGHSDGLVIQGELGDLVEDARPLTPPRRNRDMRDFVTSVNRDMIESTPTAIESRAHDEACVRHQAASDNTPTADRDGENVATGYHMLSGSGFMPASEIAAWEARVRPSLDNKIRPTKRRKTSEARALREVSGNAAINVRADDEDEGQTITGTRTSSRHRRRRSTDVSARKLHRSRSSRLPLERVPAGQGVHHLVFILPVTLHGISRLAGRSDQEASLAGWKDDPKQTHDAFHTSAGPSDVQILAAKLREVLVNRVSDAEMVQDLNVLVQTALTKHIERSFEEYSPC